jgi:hypothetical protein
LQIYADFGVDVFNENHLFQFMKLSKATDDELEEILYPELNEFIANQEYLATNSKSREDNDASSIESLPHVADKNQKTTLVKRFSPLIINKTTH